MSLIEAIKNAPCLINPTDPNNPQFPQINIFPSSQRNKLKQGCFVIEWDKTIFNIK